MQLALFTCLFLTLALCEPKPLKLNNDGACESTYTTLPTFPTEMDASGSLLDNGYVYLSPILFGPAETSFNSSSVQSMVIKTISFYMCGRSPQVVNVVLYGPLGGSLIAAYSMDASFVTPGATNCFNLPEPLTITGNVYVGVYLPYTGFDTTVICFSKGFTELSAISTGYFTTLPPSTPRLFPRKNSLWAALGV